MQSQTTYTCAAQTNTMKQLLIAAIFLLPYISCSFLLPLTARHLPVRNEAVHVPFTKLSLFRNPHEKSDNHEKEKEEEFDNILNVAYLCLEGQQKNGLMKLYNEHPDSHDYFFDNEKGELLFHGKDKRVLAHTKVQMIGTYAKKSKTWMWAWSEHHRNDLPEEQLQTAFITKEIGEKMGFQKLTEPVLCDCDEYDAWRLTAFASWTTNAAGAFRIDFGPCWWYMTLEELIIEKDGEHGITDAQIDTNSSEPLASAKAV